MALCSSNVLENVEESNTAVVLLSFGYSGIAVAKGGFIVIRTCHLLISNAAFEGMGSTIRY
ncbi:hypothetical protein VD17_18210 [Pseudomonas fluorescens]|uniref:Uncharacterized protein n=1 Tax=Pseudomonas fluorescens TaxID=294 RepID=A0A0F4V7C0_PSEFL|nr:hypothetical protein VD17_18210 [Pseudomonas fluorescens]